MGWLPAAIDPVRSRERPLSLEKKVVKNWGTEMMWVIHKRVRRSTSNGVDFLFGFAIMDVQMASALLHRKVEEQGETQGKSALSFFVRVAKSSLEIWPIMRRRRFASTSRICDSTAVLFSLAGPVSD